MNRITSYNVCYTKLLREWGYFAKDQEELYGAWINIKYGSGIPQKIVYQPVGTFNCFKDANSKAPCNVITSYSIHYTKLYEPLRRQCLPSDRFRSAVLQQCSGVYGLGRGGRDDFGGGGRYDGGGGGEEWFV